MEPEGVAEGCKVEKRGHHHAGVGAEARAHAHARHALGADKWEEDGEEDGEGGCSHRQRAGLLHGTLALGKI